MSSEKRSAEERIVFIVVVGVMSAVSVVLAYFIHFPLIPGAAFLEYDPADIVIYACTYLLGLPCGLILTAVVSIIQGITVSASSGIIGITMHIIATGGFVIAAGLVFGKLKIKSRGIRLLIATACGIITATLLMILWNIILTPIFMGVERSFVVDNLLTIFIPFNLLKAGINGILGAVFYIPVSKALKR